MIGYASSIQIVSWIVLFLESFSLATFYQYVNLLIKIAWDFQIWYFFFLLRILSIFNTHTRRGEKVLKKLTMVYIQKGLSNFDTLELKIFSLLFISFNVWFWFLNNMPWRCSLYFSYLLMYDFDFWTICHKVISC